MGLYHKMHEVMTEVAAIQRDKKIEGSKSSYMVTTEEAVLKVIRPLMVKHGLLMFPTLMTIKQNGQVAVVEGLYKIVDTDSGESETIGSVGAGYDPSDKMAGKAMTYCGKYALLKTFMIATTNDDPDNFSSESNLEQESLRAKKAQAEAAANIKDKYQLCDYIRRLIAANKIDTTTGPTLINKAMSITDDGTLKQAVDYISQFDT